MLVVDAGDFSMGTLIHTLFRTEAAEIRLMGKIGYDATTIGNHELDFDSSGLASMLTAAKASGDPLPCLLAANIKVKPDKASQSRLKQALDSFPVEPYTVIEKAGIRIGVFDSSAAVRPVISSGMRISRLRTRSPPPAR